MPDSELSADQLPDAGKTDPGSVTESIKRQLLLEEYKTLRSEIEQSIKHQHQITLSGYAAAITVAGVKADPLSASMAFLIAPYILLVMAALWSSECNRMVRAGFYIAYYVWPNLAGPYLGPVNWEKWVRRGNMFAFREAQHFLQRLVILWAPVLASAAAIFYLGAQSIGAKKDYWKPILYAVPMLAWIPLWIRVRRVSNLAGVMPDDGGVPLY